MTKDSSNTGGMGMRKHGVSGIPTQSPRFRHSRELELQRQATAEAAARARRKGVGVVYDSVRDAIEHHKKK